MQKHNDVELHSSYYKNAIEYIQKIITEHKEAEDINVEDFEAYKSEQIGQLNRIQKSKNATIYNRKRDHRR